MPTPSAASADRPDSDPQAVPAVPATPPPYAASGATSRVVAGLAASASAVGLLVATSFAWIYPALAPVVFAAATGVVAIALWWSARVDQALLCADGERLAGENHDMAGRLEGLADKAWELRESEERYRSLIDAQGDLVVRRDGDGRVTFVNPAFVKAFDRAPAAWIGKPLAVAPPPAPVVAEGRDAAGRDVRLDTATGPRWYSWVDIRMRDEIVSVARDITERKEVERALLDARHRAEAASRAKSRVLATVSHEFRTPLNGILGLTGLLAEGELTPDQATYARAVQTSGEALLALVDDMLDFSKIEAGRLDIRPEPTDLETLLEDIAELLAGRAHAKAIDIAVEIGRDVPPVVVVDPARLRQVLINLAGNAVKFTDQGGVTLSVGRARDRRTIEFAVADTGPGISPEDSERLFDEFEQSDTARSRRHGGAGLGLAISRRIVRGMGGDVTMRPRAGGGTIFSFSLDLPAAEGASAPAPDVADVAGRSILVLAPDGAEPPAIERRLADAGASARVVRTLADAAGLVGAAAAAGEPHDVVLVDARATPDSAAALARLRDAAGRRLPAAVLIEPGRRGEVDAYRAAGFDAYLVRPVRRTSLVRVVSAIAGGSGGAFHIDPGDARGARPAAQRRAAASLDVLLAEDNEINALLARAVLEQLGHSVTEVRDGDAAIAAVRDRPTGFGAILMDLHMPGLDGLSAARAIREWERTTGAPRSAILAVTADVLAETHAAARLAGIDAVVEKPMTPDVLRRALAALDAA